MDRRGVLVAAAALFAGCSGLQQPGAEAAVRTEEEEVTEVSTPEPTPSPEVTTTERPDENEPSGARDEIETARSHLNEATAAFEVEFQQVDYASRSPTFDDAPVRTAIADARESLQAAEEVATPEQEVIVEGLTDHVEVIERLLSVMSALVNSLTVRPSAVAFEEGHEEAGGELKAARSWLDEVRARLDLARTGFRTAQQTLDDADVDALTSAGDVLDQLDELVAYFETLYAGDLELRRGWSAYRAGKENFGEYRFVAVSEFKKAERHFAAGSRIYGERALRSDVPELDRTIRLVGSGSAAVPYTFTVDGALHGMTTGADDSVEGRTATGTVNAGEDSEGDEYAFAGRITEFEIGDGATVYLDGQPVDPAILGRSKDSTFDLTNTIVIDGDASYRFTVSHAIAKNSEAGSINRGDSIDGTTADGRVGGGKDAYDYAGVFTEFSLSGDAAVLINGEEVDPASLAPDPNLGPERSLGRLFRRRQCLSHNYRTAAERMQTAAMLKAKSPGKAWGYRNEAEALIENTDDPCSTVREDG